MSTKPKSRWRRWAVRLAIAIVVARLLLSLLLPWLVQLGAGTVGLTVAYRSASLCLLGLSLRFEDLVVGVEQYPDDPPLLSAQEVVIDLAMSQLLRGNIGVVDAAIDGARIELHRDAQGRLRLPRELTEGSTETAAQPAPTTDAVRFDLPLQVASARLHGVQLRFRDDACSPPFQVHLTLDADVTDLGRPDRAGAIAVRLHSPQWFDDLWLTATTTTLRERLEVAWQISLRGLRPSALPLPPLATAPLREVRALHLACRGELRGETVPTAPRRPTLAGEAHWEIDLDDRQRIAGDATAGPCRQTALGIELPFAASLRGDDLVDELLLQDGLVSLEPGHSKVTTDLRGRGIGLALLQPWLAAAGIVMPAGGLEARAGLAFDLATTGGGTSLSAEIAQLALGAGDERLELARLAITDVRATADQLAIGSIEVQGPEVTVVARRDEISVAGIRLIAGTPATSAAAGSSAALTPSLSPTAAPTMPRLHLGKLDWQGLRVVFTDTTLTPPATLTLLDGTVAGDNLVLGSAAPPSRVVATCRVPDTVGELRAELRLAPSQHTATVEAELAATGITAAALAPWLQPHGVVSVLQSGRLTMVATADVAFADDALTASARLGNVRFLDGEQVLMSLRTLELRDLRSDARGLSLAGMTIDQPYLAVHRTAPALRVLGMQYDASTATPAPPATAKGSASAAGLAPAPIAPASATTVPAATTAPAAAMRRGPVTLRSALLNWQDATAPQLALGADLTLGADDGTGAPVPFEGTLRLDRAIDAIELRGTVAMAPTAFHLACELDGRGMRGSFVSQFLPPNVTCTLHDGGAHAELLATMTSLPVPSLHVQAKRLRFTDRGEELAAIDSVEAELPRLTPEAIHIANLQVLGVRAVAASTADGLHVPGFLLRPTANAEPSASLPAPAPPIALTPPAVALPASMSLAPALRIDAFELQLERFVWRERVAEEGEPLVGTMRIRLAEPWATATDFAETPPAKIELRASAEPLCREVALDASVLPFQLQPTLDLMLRAEGIDTTSLQRLAPSLRDRVQGIVTDARLSATLHASLGLRRRDPRQFDFGRPFGGELAIENVVFQQAPEGPALASVAAIEVLARTFDPQRGDLLLRTVTIDAPMLQAQRTADGIELLGLRLLPAMSPGDPAAPAAPDAPAASAASAETEIARPIQPAAAEFAIDRLQVQGLAFTFADATTDPPTHLPLEDVDMELRRFSSRAFTEPRRLAFSVAVRGGEVELEQRIVRSSAIAGFLTSTVGALVGSADVYKLEPRPLLDEFRIAGQLQLHPQLTGEIHSSISSLELPALRGLAKTSGVDLADGLLDLRLDATLRPDGIELDNRTTFTWLSLTEPPGGPISTYLRLPAPLDTVLFLLRNEDDEHQLPMQLLVPAAGLSGGAIAGAAAEAVVKIVADAVAGAALRTTGALTGAIGLGGGPDLRTLMATATFAPGDPTPHSDDLAPLLQAAAADPEVCIVLTHELGAADLVRAAVLANPPPAVVAEAGRRLRLERDAATGQRNELAAEVAAHFAAGQLHDARRKQLELSRLDDGLGRLEQAIDEALGMLAEPNPRATHRRTKQGALAMAQARLRAVHDDLRRHFPTPGPTIEQRQPRAVPAVGLPKGGRIVISLRRGQEQ